MKWRERLEDALLLTLKIEERAKSQGKWATSRSQKTDPPRASGRNAALPTP